MKKNVKFYLFLLPSFLGLVVFYIIPFLVSFYYSLIDNNISRNFVGLKNYLEVLNNEFFQKATINTFFFVLASVLLSMIISFFMAILLNSLKKFKAIVSVIYMLPLVIPSGTIVFFWKNIFDINGVVNKFLFTIGKNNINFAQSKYVFFIIILIYLWKNIGYNIIIFLTGISWISKENYEFATLEGANFFQKNLYITLPSLIPSIFVVFLVSLSNSFSAYKETFLMYGNYPNENIYFLQHYMNNLFNSLNYQKLTSSAYIFVFFWSMIVFVFFILQKKFTEQLE